MRLAAVGKAGHGLRFGPASRRETRTYDRPRELAGLLARRACGHHGRRARHHGGSQPRLPRGGRSFDRLHIEPAHEQAVNPYVDLGVEFRYFFARKVMFVKYADGFASPWAALARSTSCLSRWLNSRRARSPFRSCSSAPSTGRLAHWLRREPVPHATSSRATST